MSDLIIHASIIVVYNTRLLVPFGRLSRWPNLELNFRQTHTGHSSLLVSPSLGILHSVYRVVQPDLGGLSGALQLGFKKYSTNRKSQYLINE